MDLYPAGNCWGWGDGIELVGVGKFGDEEEVVVIGGYAVALVVVWSCGGGKPG